MGDWADLNEVFLATGNHELERLLYAHRTRRKRSGHFTKQVTVSLSEEQYEFYKAMGGAVALRRIIEKIKRECEK